MVSALLNKRFGWHSGSMKCRDAIIYNDLSIYGDLTFGDVSTDTFTVTGNFTSTADVLFTLGAGEAFTLTCDDISAPIVMTNTITTAAKTGARALFHTKFNVAVGGWVNALKGYTEITGTAGYTTGLASAVVAEMKFGEKASLSGSYYPLEIEVVAPATFSVLGNGASNAGFIYARVSGTTDNWEDEAWFMRVTDLTAASGNMLSANLQTLRCAFGSQGTPIESYLMFSDAEDVLSLGTFASPRAFITDTPVVMISGDAASDLASGVSRCAWFRAKVSGAQTGNSIMGIEAQCRVSDATTLGAGQNTGIWAYWEESGTVALNTGNLSSAISCTVESAATLTIDSGAILAGVVIDSSVNASTTNNGTFDGIYIKKASGALDFVSGIEMTDCISSEVFKFADDGTICNDAGMTASSSLDNFNDFSGYITIMIGSTATHLLTLDTIPS